MLSPNTFPVSHGWNCPIFPMECRKTKIKSFHLSSHNFISILGIINCINELKSATFLPPLFARVPLHRQFLQKSTKIRSRIFATNVSTKIRWTALFSVWKVSASLNSEERKSVLRSSVKSCVDLSSRTTGLQKMKPYHDGIDDVVVVVLQGAYSLRPRHVGLWHDQLDVLNLNACLINLTTNRISTL